MCLKGKKNTKTHRTQAGSFKMKMITIHAKIKQRGQKTNAEKIKQHQNT